MNQDAFRHLLQTTKPAESGGASQPKKKYGITPASQPAFQPRKVKGPRSSYRDRASERRAGINEYEKIESAIHDLEKGTADLGDRDEVDKQGQYLGGDKDHTGLDFALLEQDKAKMAASNAVEEDETLEAAFRQKSDQPTTSNKRTREDIIRELKERKAQEAVVTGPGPSATVVSLEKAKALGKFKPIGASHPSKYEKKREAKEEKEHMRKRKKRKIENERNKPEIPPVPKNSESSAVEGSTELNTIAEAVTEEPDSGLNIFADVEEYKGIDLGDDEDEDEKYPETEDTKPQNPLAPSVDRKWFNDEEMAVTAMAGPPSPHSLSPIKAEPRDEVQEETESIQITKLTPLASSDVPSIRDLLVMDAAAQAAAKRKARKEKKKAKSTEGGNKKELSEAAKLDRDYKKLNSYMSRKD